MSEVCRILFLFFIFLINEVGYFIIDLLILFKSYWTTKALKVLFYIYASFAIIRFIQLMVFFTLSIINRCKKMVDCLLIVFGVLYFFFILVFWLLGLIVININLKKFKNNFWKNCPFVIDEAYYSENIRRRCDLYNRNFNSRYSYQYICSYDPSDDFKYSLSEEIEPDQIICINYNNPIEDNSVIQSFINVYNEEKKFYCGRTNKPTGYSKVKPKDCKDSKKRIMVLFVPLYWVRILFILWPLYSACLLTENAMPNINPFFPNFGDISRKSTFESDTEKENENENFEEGKTVNIIIEQKNEFIVDTNIQDLEPKNNNILKNDIDVHQKDIGSYKNLDITL